MFTVCPKCALTLVVTAEDLRVAQGYVRCGRCSSVFNALARLSENRQPEGPPALPPSLPREPAPPAQVLAPQEAERPALSPFALDDDAIPEGALEFDPSKTDVSSVFIEPPPNPQWAAATGTFKAMLAANQEAAHAEEEALHPAEPSTAAREAAPPAPDEDSDIDVELDADLLASILQAEPGAAPPPAAAAPAAQAPPAVLPPPPQPPAPPAQLQPAAPPAPSARRSPPPSRAPPPPPAPSAPSFERPARFLRSRRSETPPRARHAAGAGAGSWAARLWPYAWSGGAALALLVLCAQMVNHHRDDLAASARFNRPLTAVYAALGVHLVPRWDLRAYDVRQLGASVEPSSAGLITVRASIKNAAPQAQPLPLLRVTLQDRFGNRIAARDVAPPSYLPRPPPGTAFLSAGQRIDAEMGFVDPGANAVGFEIDACLPTSGGEVTCANDAAAR